MAATGTAAAAATGRLLVLLLLRLTAPAAALAGYVEVGSGREPERSLLASWKRGLRDGGRGKERASRGVHPLWARRGAGARGGWWSGAAAGLARLVPPPPWRSAQPWRSGCLSRRRGQMKDVGAAGGGGPPRPPQRQVRPPRRPLLAALPAAQTPTTPSSGTQSGPRGVRGLCWALPGEAAAAVLAGEVGSPPCGVASRVGPRRRRGAGRARPHRLREGLGCLRACPPLRETRRAGPRPWRRTVQYSCGPEPSE